MNKTPTLTQLARRMMTQEVGEIRDSEGLASGVVAVYAKLLTRVSSLVGVMGSIGLFRRSLRLMQAAFPRYTEVLGDEQNGLLNAVGVCLRKQAPDVIREASVALLTAYLELLMTFIGERLTRQLVLEAWPELLTPSSQEKQA
jgi:hypothetical protein